MGAVTAGPQSETRYRCPAASPIEDESYEDAALREAGEECGELTIEDLTPSAPAGLMIGGIAAPGIP
jgi:hypothetical protein